MILQVASASPKPALNALGYTLTAFTIHWLPPS
jgi:hypothetical protein